MNKELYLNETTNVGLVVDDNKKLKRVESNENEDTVKIRKKKQMCNNV